MKRLMVIVVLLSPLVLHAAEPPEGVQPLGADGKPLNLDFETGTLQDWTATGTAFAGQPIKGDTVFPRRADNKSQHEGQYWIGGFEKHGDGPQGTLTSVPFRITHSWASFLVGGGPHDVTCVELVRKDNNQVVHRASGFEEENLRREVVDLKALQGKEIYIRLVDKHSGHWGHINFDDFRFHTDKPNFPARKGSVPVQVDVLKFAGLSPEKAAKAMTVPEGFEVKLFAGEPDVHQPIAFCLDDRGRLWVAEAYCYPQRKPPVGPILSPQDGESDKIVIFEDTNGDGKFDKRTVFMEGLNLVSGLEVGFGGVWIGAAPYLLFVPIKEGEDKPADNPQILLDGWGWHDTHETLNTFMWGPDGWLYGCHGVFTHSRVGKPGTPDNERIPINAGVWRYHPTKHKFEVFAHGTSNPWGLDFNDYGQAFVEACVIPHCFHIIQGGRYQRQAGGHFNLHTYDDIKTIADHFHYLGANPHGGNNKSDSAGGGHAHCGTMIYLGGTWPLEYRDRMFMGNIHGRRLNVDILKEKGSGYVASHGPDFLLANDAWARFINLRYGPDGNVYLIDWYDKQACHTGDVKIWDRSNGRIYKICYRGTTPPKPPPGRGGKGEVDLAKLSDKELVQLQTHPNDWYVRHGRRLLQERAHKGKLDPAVHAELEKIAVGSEDDKQELRKMWTSQLRAMWALHVTGGLTEKRIKKSLDDLSPHVRGWAIQLALENAKPTTDFLTDLAELARADSSPIVHLYLASALQRIAPEKRWDILEGLLNHGDEVSDHNLPFMYWYAAELLADVDHRRAFNLALGGKIPLVLNFMVRRIVWLGGDDKVKLLVSALAQTDDLAGQRILLTGLTTALHGRRQVKMPEAWPEAYEKLSQSRHDDIKMPAAALAVIFGDQQVMDELRKTISLPGLKSPLSLPNWEQFAFSTLLEARDPKLLPVLQRMMNDPMLVPMYSAVVGQIIRGLAAYDDPKTPKIILDVYSTLPGQEKRDALSTLASRVTYGKALADALSTKRIAAADVPAEIVRQLRNLNDKELDKRIEEVWGIVRSTPADKARLIAQQRGMLMAPNPLPDLHLGRAIFAKTCAQCHILFGIGNKVGPELTGSNRADLNYLLENMLDPSAVIPKEYTATLFELKSGRVITGLVTGSTPAVLTVATANETVTIPKDDIELQKPSTTSMMPDDLLKSLNPMEIRSLVAYLQSPNQVPMLANADSAKDFFNGKDLTGWDGDPKLWKIENGEIVGKSPGIKHNEFLKSHLLAGDFRLTLKVKLTPNSENSGIQFRSEVLPGGDVKGYQADVGQGWWGKLYEEHGRGILWDKSGEAHVKQGDWNEYEIVALGSKIRTFINGKACVDVDDPSGARRGIFALQIHSGGPMEVRFKDLKLEVGNKKTN